MSTPLPFKSFADAKRRVEQGVSIYFTHFTRPEYNGPARVIMWERLGFAINRVPPGSTDAGFLVRWPKLATDFDPATGTIFKDGEPHMQIKLLP